MNAAPPTSQMGTMGRLVGAAVIIVVAAVLLYYMYDYLFNVTQVSKKAQIVGGPIKSTSTMITYPGASQSDIDLGQFIFTGGELAVSFWIYVTGPGTDPTKKHHILSLGRSDTDDASTLIVALGGNQNVLYVHVKDTDTFDYSSFMGTSGGNETKACNLQNIEFGRWVNVSIVLNNNLCDVYLDGKLSRSCVLKSQWQAGYSNTAKPSFYVLKQSFTSPSMNTDWAGSFANLVYYNYAISPDEIYRIYMAGPSGGGGDLWSKIKAFFGQGTTTTAVTS